MLIFAGALVVREATFAVMWFRGTPKVTEAPA
jgi:hypothetical protein